MPIRLVNDPQANRSVSLGMTGRKGTVQFKIKDQEYFLAFVEQENRWYVFAPTAQGLERLPVYVDTAKWETAAVMGSERTLSS